LDTNGDGIVDALDANGDGKPNDLNGNGAFADEVVGLGDAQRYQPGSTFWRVAVTHFTPWDCNWPYGPPPDAITPNPVGGPEADQQKNEEEDCRKSRSSFVEERSRIFHEDIPIPGTDIKLHYASNRVKGYSHKITVPVSGNAVPSTLKKILVRLNVAGRSFEEILNPQPNQKVEFIWDNLDHLGRVVSGPITALVSIGFVYDAVYYSAGNFAQAFAQAGNNVTGIQARQEVISWRDNSILIAAKTKEDIAEGWTIFSHHYISPVNPYILLKGDGTVIMDRANILETIAGNGISGYSGDGGPAIEANLFSPVDIKVDAEKNLYIADGRNFRIRKVNSNGIITTVAGKGTRGFSGDEDAALQAEFNGIVNVAVDSTGNLFITDFWNGRIRKVDTDGIITTVAGDGSFYCGGDGGLAKRCTTRVV
jgi:hypothetical protein